MRTKSPYWIISLFAQALALALTPAAGLAAESPTAAKDPADNAGNAESSPGMCPLRHGTWEFSPQYSDEFSGPSLDEQKWQVRGTQKARKSRLIFEPDNVTVSDGQLHLAIKKKILKDDPEIVYSAAVVKTTAMMRYGYYEVKCRLADCFANNAYWFARTDRNAGGTSEIDVFEATGPVATPSTRTDFLNVSNAVYTTLHVLRSLLDQKHIEIGPKNWPSPAVLDKEFHRYGLEWDEDHILVYFDGELIQGNENVYHHYPLPLLFSIASFPPFDLPPQLQPGHAGRPSTLDVEYVRSWKRTDVADKRVWDFAFALPDRKQRYSIPTTDQGTLLIYTIDDFIKVNYANPDFFRTQTAPTITKAVEVKDKSGKLVRFCFDYSREHGKKAADNGYKAYRLYIEPVQKQAKGSSETFVFPAENGQDVALTITY